MGSSTKGKQGKKFNFEEKIAEVENAKQDEKDQTMAKIQRVPKHIREREELHQFSSSTAAAPQMRAKYFTPTMLSVGPIHYKLHLGEQYKLRWMAKYLQLINTAELHQNIRRNIQTLKNLFEKDVIIDYEDDELAWILFMDGCSVLHFMKSYKAGDPVGLDIKYDQMVYMCRDLILLENQLPYQVLLLLTSCEHQLQKIITSYFAKILDLRLEENSDCHCQQKTSDHQAIEFKERPTHVLHFLRQVIIKYFIGCEVRQDNKGNKAVRPTYKNIRDLKAAKIRVKKAKATENIHFSSGIFGHLEIPEFTVDDSTAITILNVIAYEMCPDFQNNYEVSAFVEFLESVIDDAEDVKELRKAGVIVNTLGSDEEVAELFNCFSCDLVVPNKYECVRRQIELQYTRTLRTWIAQFLSDHFSSPWTVGAFLAAVLALLLSSIQTYFSLFPRK